MHAPAHTRKTGEHKHIVILAQDIRPKREDPFGEPRISSVKISTYFLDCRHRYDGDLPRIRVENGGSYSLICVILLSRYRPLGREKNDYYFEK